MSEFTSLRQVILDVGKNSKLSGSEMVIDGGIGQNVMIENMDVELLGHILNLLASSVLYHPAGKDLVKNDEGRLTTIENHHGVINRINSNGTPRFLAIEELLHTAATGMRCLVSLQCGYDFNKDFFFEADPWPLIPQNNNSSCHNESSTVKIDTTQLSSTITAVGQILTSLSLFKSNDQGVSASIEKGAAQSKIALKTALLNAQTRRIIAAAADLLHKCLLMSADSTVLDCSRTLLPQVLNFLPACYSDLSDPFSLASLSAMHSLKSQAPLQQSGSGVDRILRDEARNVGSVRIHIGQIIALSCQNADENYISNLIRVLNHKLSKLSLIIVSDNGSATTNKAASADALAESELVLIAGTISTLGFTAECIAAWMYRIEEHVQHEDMTEEQIQVHRYHNSKKIQSKAIVDNICNLLLDTISSIFKFAVTASPQSIRIAGSVKDPVIEKDRFGEIKIVALNILRDFAARGLLKISDKRQLSNLIGEGEGIQMNTAPAVTIATSNTCRITTIFDFLVDYVKSFSLREASGVNNTPINGRSTSNSKIAAAAIDVLSAACLAGVAEGAVSPSLIILHIYEFL